MAALTKSRPGRSGEDVTAAPPSRDPIESSPRPERASRRVQHSIKIAWKRVVVLGCNELKALTVVTPKGTRRFESFGVILQLATLFLAFATIVREREIGTLEQMFVAPVGNNAEASTSSFHTRSSVSSRYWPSSVLLTSKIVNLFTMFVLPRCGSIALAAAPPICINIHVHR